MNKYVKNNVESLLESENEQIKKLHEVVIESLKEEKLIAQRLRKRKLRKVSWSEHLSDQIASFGGSWSFIVGFLVIISIWIFVNSIIISPVDPYPFILLNLLLSLVAAIQAPIIIMSQNRQDQKDRERSEDDYLINLKAELEIRSLHEKVDAIIIEHLQSMQKTLIDQSTLLQNLKAKHESQ